MQKQNRFIILSIALIVVAIAGITTIAIAAPNLQWGESSAEPGAEPGTQAEVLGDGPDEDGFTGTYESQAAPGGEASTSGVGEPAAAIEAVSEPQPDEDGYTGPIYINTKDDNTPSGEADTAAQPDWDALITGPQADDSLQAPEEPGWSNFYYVHVAGSTLRPRSSSNEWENSSDGGCLYNTAGSTSGIYNIHLEIPNGSRIDYLRIYYYDTNTTNNNYGWVTIYDDAGGYTDLTTVASAGSAGYGTTLSPLVSHVVNNINDSYVLNWRPFATNSTSRLCGFRVAYRLPD